MYNATEQRTRTHLEDLVHALRNRLNRLTLMTSTLAARDEVQRRRLSAMQDTIQELSRLLGELQRATERG